MQISALKKPVLMLALAIALVVGLSRPSLALLDKTRFAARVGVAYFCFHHWVSNPYREGKFAAGAPHRTATIVKAGTALLFAVHELKIASKIAHMSKDPLLHNLAASSDNLTNTFTSVGQKFKGGKFNPDDVENLTGAYTGLDSGARAAKIEIKDTPVPVPGT